MFMKISVYLCFLLWFVPLHVEALELMLPKVYTGNIDVAGWLVSEKLDGFVGIAGSAGVRS
jgi:hypothetical protein